MFQKRYWSKPFVTRFSIAASIFVCSSLVTVCGTTAFAAEVRTSSQAGVPTVVVVASTPLPGSELDKNQLAAPVQTATSEDLDRSHAIDLTAFMNRELGSVYINDIQNNPLQADVNYRGYTASPLLGTPQGLSVYMDGVRLNQPFGDVVSWDLIPRAAIASIALMPGSNPLFGLNTLGGSLSIRTKDGYSDPGSAAQLSYGSNNRRVLELETGGHRDNGVYWYATGNKFTEDGWREDSPSSANQLFGKLGWRSAASDISLSGAYADTDLNGNGLQEQRLLADDYASVYTKPDNTQNRSDFFNLAMRHAFNERVSFSGNAYYRDIKSTTFNGDVNGDSLAEDVYQPNPAERAALSAAGYTGFPMSGESSATTPFPSWRCIADALLNTEPNEKCNGLVNRTRTSQSDGGISAQFTFAAELSGRSNQFTAGAAYGASHSHFTQSSQFGYLTPDRGIVIVNGSGAFADGGADLTGRTDTKSVYATDTLALMDRVQLTLSGRYDDTSIKNRDALTPSGQAGSLTGDHSFSRFNPAAGLYFSPAKQLAGYIGYSESSRTPSAIELGCADPDNPCRLPNAMAGDPPLNQVVTKTLEAGLRGTTGVLEWNTGVFRAENHDDIMFVAGNTAGFGYFKNFGKTQRQGVELGASGHVSSFSFGAHYTYMDATYRSAQIVGGDGNSSNDGPAPGFDGNIEIHPGDHVPLTPHHIFKTYAQWDATRQLSVDVDMIAIGGSYARGNENNQHQADGLYYLGAGKTGGYAVFNLGADYRPTAALKIFAQIDNLFDREYSTASQLAATGFTDTGSFIARPFSAPVIGDGRPLRHATFYAPGAPRTYVLGLRYGVH